jgi:hypothetical protein
MIVWFIIAPLVGATAAVASVLTGNRVWALALTVATVMLTAQAFVYAPRAWKAHRNG